VEETLNRSEKCVRALREAVGWEEKLVHTRGDVETEGAKLKEGKAGHNRGETMGMVKEGEGLLIGRVQGEGLSQRLLSGGSSSLERASGGRGRRTAARKRKWHKRKENDKTEKLG